MGRAGQGAPALRVVTSADPDAPEPAWSDDDVAWGLGPDAPPSGDPAPGHRPRPRRPTSLAEAAEVARPTTLGLEHTLPLVDALAPLVPGGALVRGTTVAVEGGPGATSLALACAAGPSARAGSWVAVVGLGALGLVAAVEAGVDPERLVLVDEPPPAAWGQVVAALVGAVDVVVVAPTAPVRAADARRLAARARERGSVLVAVGGDAVAVGGSGAVRAGRAAPGLEPDLRLRAVGASWVGLADGHGHLGARSLQVEAVGRRRAARPRRGTLWLPATGGGVEAVAGPGPAHVGPPVEGRVLEGRSLEGTVHEPVEEAG